MTDNADPPIVASACECFGVDLMYEAEDNPEVGRVRGQPVIILALSEHDGATARASLDLEAARYLLRELAAALDEVEADDE
jgi:hypothetical protein